MTTHQPPGRDQELAPDLDQGQDSPLGQARALQQVQRSLKPQILRTSSRNFGKSFFRRKETTSHPSLSRSMSVRPKMTSVTTFLTRSSVTDTSSVISRASSGRTCALTASCLTSA